MGRFSNNYNPFNLTGDGVRHLKQYRTARDNFLKDKKCQYKGCENKNLSVHHHWTFWNTPYLKIKIGDLCKKYNITLSDEEIKNLIVVLMEIQIKEYISFKNCDVFCKEHHHKRHMDLKGNWMPEYHAEGHHPLHKELHKLLRGLRV